MFALDPFNEHGQRAQFLLARFQAVGDVMRRVTKPKPQKSLDQQHGREQVGGPADPDPLDDEGRRRGGNERQDDPGPALLQAPRRSGPRDELVGPQGRVHLRTEHGKVLAEIELRGQFQHSLLPIADDRRLTWRHQPGRKHVLAAACPGGHQQLEQPAGTEQIKVLGVEMVRVAVPLASLARAMPAIGQAVKAALVERFCSRHTIAAVQDASVNIQERQKGHERQRQPRRPLATEHHDDGDAGKEETEPQPREPGMRCFEASVLASPFGEPGPVGRLYGRILPSVFHK